MKKVLAILAGGALIVLLAACDISSYFKPKSTEQTQQQATEPPPPETPPAAEPPATEPPPAQTTPPPAKRPAPPPAQQPYQQPAQQPYQPPTQAAPPPAQQPYQPPAQNNYNETAPLPKARKAGLGVIFTGNLEQGQFRVKVDQELVYELAFSGKETRATKELSLEAGQHMIRFAVVDANGVRGIKEETFNFKPGTHQTVRVSVKDTPGAIIVEHLD